MGTSLKQDNAVFSLQKTWSVSQTSIFKYIKTSQTIFLTTLLNFLKYGAGIHYCFQDQFLSKASTFCPHKNMLYHAFRCEKFDFRNGRIEKSLVVFTRIPQIFKGRIHWFVKVNTVLSMIKMTSWALFYSPYIRWCGSPLSLLSFGYAWTDLSRGNTYLWVTGETISSRMNFLLSLHFSSLCLLSVWLILVSPFFSPFLFLFRILYITSS